MRYKITWQARDGKDSCEILDSASAAFPRGKHLINGGYDPTIEEIEPKGQTWRKQTILDACKVVESGQMKGN